MTNAADAASGKGHGDENFPVASRLIAPRHRGPILAFYRFVRAADDVSDHPTLTGPEKLALLDGLEAALTGDGPPDPVAEPLRLALAERRLGSRHAQDLLDAFRLDARKSRTANWNELIHYCSLSAMPVGRFVLDVHGEDRSTWPASDALCAALQIINHVQDCGKDFRDLDRVYVPADVLARHGAAASDLGASPASPALRAALAETVERTDEFLEQSAVFPTLIADTRLALEVAVIHGLAGFLLARLKVRDPLFERVHAGKGEAALVAARSVLTGLWKRRRRATLTARTSP